MSNGVFFFSTSATVPGLLLGISNLLLDCCLVHRMRVIDTVPCCSTLQKHDHKHIARRPVWGLGSPPGAGAVDGDDDDVHPLDASVCVRRTRVIRLKYGPFKLPRGSHHRPIIELIVIANRKNSC